MSTAADRNALGEEKINKLLLQFAIPSIISMLVGSLYNIVDQFFIGRSVGELGNAATNISFPLSISCIAIGLLFGIGGASAFNLVMGRGDKEKAAYYMGNAAVMLMVCGTVLCLITQIFLEPMLKFFGSPANVLDYAMTYTRIVSFGFPFVIFATGGGHLIRADGSPRMTMLCNLSGAVINTILDALFVFVFQMGMAGAAFATVIGQIISAALAFSYMIHCKSVELSKKHLKVQRQYVTRIMALGAAPCSNQISMMIVQIVMNKSLKYYGSLSAYGESVPIACAGIITKVNQVFMSFVIGISQGLQPLVSFNYGAGKYDRVKTGYRRAVACGFVLSLLAFLMFQLIPGRIISIFGDGSEAYFRFATNYFRIYLFFTFINFMQPITSNFFTAIGKPKRGMFLALTRQIILLLPLIIIFPLFMGIDGIMYAGPVADGAAGVITAVMIVYELRRREYQQ